ncbi:MAG: transcriptional repressor LexA [Microthrixaceae bacterium]
MNPGDAAESNQGSRAGRAASSPAGSADGGSTDRTLTQRQRDVLVCIDDTIRERGYPPSVREIGEKVGLASPSTVHSHLRTLQELGYLRRDPTKPRAIEVTADLGSGAPAERRPTRHVPLVGDGELFMLRVRGDSMVDAGILDGDFVVARVQDVVRNGDIVVAGIPGEEATVKTYRRDAGAVVLEPANERLEPMRFENGEVSVFGKVVTVLRKL